MDIGAKSPVVITFSIFCCDPVVVFVAGAPASCVSNVHDVATKAIDRVIKIDLFIAQDLLVSICA